MQSDDVSDPIGMKSVMDILVQPAAMPHPSTYNGKVGRSCDSLQIPWHTLSGFRLEHILMALAIPPGYSSGHRSQNSYRNEVVDELFRIGKHPPSKPF